MPVFINSFFPKTLSKSIATTALVALGLTGCSLAQSQSVNQSTQKSQPTVQTPSQSLQGRWVLDPTHSTTKTDTLSTLSADSYLLISLKPHDNNTQNTQSPLKDITLTGTIGCNMLSRNATLDSQTQTLSTKQHSMITTLMFCETLDAQEKAFAKFLDNLNSYTLKDRRLFLSDSHGDTLAFNFDRLHQKWRLLNAHGIQAPDITTSQATLDLTRLYQGSANAGCNTLNFSYQTPTPSTQTPSDTYPISFGKVSATRMACPNMTLESVLSEFLPTVTQYKIEYLTSFGKDALSLYNEQGNSLYFMAQ